MNKKKLIIAISILMVLILILLLVLVVVKKQKTQISTVISIETDQKTDQKIDKSINEALIKQLSGLSEQKRIEYYATEFIKALEGRKISTAYKLLNEDFKTNYFKTEESFGEYVKIYFPKEVSVKYVNMERLENIYVLEVEIKDILTSVNPNHFDCYIIIKENEYADYELSFSVDSAMKNSKDADELEEVDNESTEEVEDFEVIYEADVEQPEENEEMDAIPEEEEAVEEELEEIEDSAEAEENEEIEETEE